MTRNTLVSHGHHMYYSYSRNSVSWARYLDEAQSSPDWFEFKFYSLRVVTNHLYRTESFLLFTHRL